MRVFEYGQKENMSAMDPVQQKFTAKMIVREVERIAKEHDISEETAYWAYMQGLYGGDRELTY